MLIPFLIIISKHMALCCLHDHFNQLHKLDNDRIVSVHVNVPVSLENTQVKGILHNMGLSAYVFELPGSEREGTCLAERFK